MSIGTSYTVTPQTKRMPPNPQQAVPSPQGGVVFAGSQGSHDSVHFGNAATSQPTYRKHKKDFIYRQNAVWVSTEDPDAKQGGLGEVTETIPTAAVMNSTPKGQELRDIRVITPFVRMMRKENDKRIKNGEDHFKPTNLSFPVKINNKGDAQFKVLQKWQPVAGDANRGYMRYALQSEVFEGVDKIDTYEAYNPKSKALLIPFSRGASKLVEYLKASTQQKPGKALPTPKAGEEALKVFNSDQINVIGNDHLSGPVLYQPEIANDPDIRKGFVYHNIYDSAVPAPEAAYDRGYEIPKGMTQTDLYSPLTLSPQVAHWAVANGNFAKTIVDTGFSKGQIYVDPLREHIEAGTLTDLHHPLDPTYTPVNNQFLQRNHTQEDEKVQCVDKSKSYQFASMAAGQENSSKAWAAFKQANKQALQTKYGLKENPKAVLMSWAARLEPNQKGFYMVQNSIEKLLKKPGNENLQIVIAGNVGGKPDEFSLKQKEMTAWIEEFNKKVKEDPALQGRVYFPNRFVKKDEITQINAASDFTMLPSVYEPYGITQLEAYKMGSIPLVHAVDGIRSSVAHPKFQQEFPDFITEKAIKEGDVSKASEKVWAYGQTGVLLKPFPVAEYRKALSRDELITELEQKVAEAPGKIYTPKKTREFESLKKMLDDLCADENLHLPNEKKSADKPEHELFKPEHELFKVELKTRAKALNASLEKSLWDGDAPVLTEADLQVLKDIRQVDKEKITNKADENFEDAVDRAMRLSPSERTKIRENGHKYLDENHSLAAIGERWRTILDSPNSKPGEDLEFGDPSFDKPAAPKAAKAASEVSTPTRRKPVVVQKEPTGIWSGSWQSISNVLSIVTYYLNPFNWFSKSKK